MGMLLPTVSPVIEALLTVAIAIGGGALFYGFYSGLLSSLYSGSISVGPPSFRIALSPNSSVSVGK